MDISYIGILGGIILVLGAMWKSEETTNPRRSVKNWLFGIGNICMFLFSILDYIFGSGLIFFVILQSLIILSTIFMFFPIDEKKSTILLFIVGVGALVWSLFLFQNYTTIFFTLGLLTLAIGFASTMGTLRRVLALCLGSILVAIFSYFSQAWVFFWLNVFFAIFSGWQVMKLIKRTTS